MLKVSAFHSCGEQCVAVEADIAAVAVGGICIPEYMRQVVGSCYYNVGYLEILDYSWFEMSDTRNIPLGEIVYVNYNGLALGGMMQYVEHRYPCAWIECEVTAEHHRIVRIDAGPHGVESCSGCAAVGYGTA